MTDAPYPEDMLETGSAEEVGAMGAGTDARDLAAGDGGDATGGGSPGDQDAMGGHEHEDESDADAQIGGIVSPGSTAGKNPPPGGDDAAAAEIVNGETPDADLQVGGHD